MFRRILVPLDGSSFAEAAVPAALSLAERHKGEVHLLRVVERLAADVLPQIDPPDLEGAQMYLQALVESAAEGSRARVTFSLREGAPIEEIAAAAREWRAELVVMCTHGRSALSRVWLGSVADRFLRGAELPVLLIRPPERLASATLPFTFSRVVTPLDGSRRAEAAIPWAAALARAYGTPLELVEAIVYPGAPEFDWPEGAEIVLAAEQAALAYLDDVSQRTGIDGVQISKRVIRSQAAGQVALEAADGNPIVISTRGRGPLGRAFLGSVTDKIVRGAVGPVLVIPPRFAEATQAAETSA